MPTRVDDPSRLHGEELRRWYLRSPTEIEDEREAAQKREYEEFFGTSTEQPASPHSALLIREAYTPNTGMTAIQVGNPHNRRLIREWEQREGKNWPRDPANNRRYDVGHIKALADGGTNTLDNIEPIHPNEHRAQHMRNGDTSRWAKRSHIARAFGGRVVPRLGALSALSDLFGMLSGRIRIDSIDNMAADMEGRLSLEDRRRIYEHKQRAIDPDWKWGDKELAPEFET